MCTGRVRGDQGAPDPRRPRLRPHLPRLRGARRRRTRYVATSCAASPAARSSRPAGSGSTRPSWRGSPTSSWSRWLLPIRAPDSIAARSPRILTAEEERSRARCRGLRLFEEICGCGDAISGEDAFRAPRHLRLPEELTRELAHERGLGSTRRSSPGGWRSSASARARPGGPRRSALFVGRARPTSSDTRRTEGARRRSPWTQTGRGRLLGEALRVAFYAEGGGQVSDAGLDRAQETAHAPRSSRRSASATTRQLVFEGEGSRRRPGQGRRRGRHRFRPWRPHGHAPPAHGAPRGARDHAEQAGSAVGRTSPLRSTHTRR